MQIHESVDIVKLIVQLLKYEVEIVPNWIYTYPEDSMYLTV